VQDGKVKTKGDNMNGDSTVPKSQSKRVKLFSWFKIGSLVSLLTLLAAVGHLPIIGSNKWVAIVAGIATTILGWLGQHYGVKDSGVKIVED
jgi:hypothetical protein